jgi:hypothetical protein
MTHKISPKIAKLKDHQTENNKHSIDDLSSKSLVHFHRVNKFNGRDYHVFQKE